MAITPKYLDKNLPAEERAKDLVSHMTLEEKASQLKYDAPAIKGLISRFITGGMKDCME